MRVKGKLYPHRYEPIITKKLFDEAQSIRERANKQPRKYGGLPYFYRGLLTCGHCGMRITVEKQKGIVYYHYTQSRGKHGAKYVTEDQITQQLQNALAAIQPNNEQFKEVMLLLKKSNEDKVKYRKAQYGLLTADPNGLSRHS